MNKNERSDFILIPGKDLLLNTLHKNASLFFFSLKMQSHESLLLLFLLLTLLLSCRRFLRWALGGVPFTLAAMMMMKKKEEEERRRRKKKKRSKKKKKKERRRKKK